LSMMVNLPAEPPRQPSIVFPLDAPIPLDDWLLEGACDPLLDCASGADWLEDGELVEGA
jgi:hypothetical protein